MYLFDTQALIWYFDGNPALPDSISKIISETQNIVMVSRASFWELSIKISIGKLRLSLELGQIMESCEKAGFGILGIENEHILQLKNLEHHHRDPFDRMLISQCLAEDMNIISSDQAFDFYPIQRIWS
jgi:PIN domain nuclease of toxin-antitoxin system